MKTQRNINLEDRSDPRKNAGCPHYYRCTELCGHSRRLPRKSRARHAAAEFLGNLKQADMHEGSATARLGVRDFEIHWISSGFRISEWISGFQSGFLDFKADFWISKRISGFQSGFLDFKADFWISKWISREISGFQSGFLDIQSGFLEGFLDFKRISGFQSGFLDFI